MPPSFFDRRLHILTAPEHILVILFAGIEFSQNARHRIAERAPTYGIGILQLIEVSRRFLAPVRVGKRLPRIHVIAGKSARIELGIAVHDRAHYVRLILFRLHHEQRKIYHVRRLADHRDVIIRTLDLAAFVNDMDRVHVQIVPRLDLRIFVDHIADPFQSVVGDILVIVDPAQQPFVAVYAPRVCIRRIRVAVFRAVRQNRVVKGILDAVF